MKSLLVNCWFGAFYGVVRIHGPVSRRCPGSGKPPSSLTSAPRDSSLSAAPSSSTVANSRRHSSPRLPTAASIQLQPCGKILKRIPRSSRVHAANKLADILEEVIAVNEADAWIRLLNFARRCLRVPKRGGRRWNLARQVNLQLSEECDPPVSSSNHKLATKSGHVDPLSSLASRVATKLEEGDFRGAVRLACSEDSIAEVNDATIAALRAKHPAPHPSSCLPPPPNELEIEGALLVAEGEVANAIHSFPKGSASGVDGLRPQHLLDLTSTSAGLGG